MSLARWTSKSTYELADELERQGYAVSAELVRRLLHQLGYSLQAPSKQKEGTKSPDRDAQFNYLNETAVAFISDGQPVISVDTKKKLRHEVARSERTRRSEVRPMDLTWRRRPDSNRGTGLCRPLPKPLGHAAVRAGR